MGKLSAQWRGQPGLLRASASPLAAALLVFLAQLPYFDLWFNFMDEGHMVQFADMARRGGEFYRDATFYPLPGAFAFLSLVFDVFGPSIIVSRWLVMIQFTLFVTGVFVLLRSATSEAWAWLGVFAMLLYRVWAFPHWQIYSYSTTSLLVLLASALVLLRFLRSGDRRMLALSGLLFGLGVLCKQDYGAAAMVTFVVVLAVWARTGQHEGRRPLPSLLLIFFAPAAAVGVATGLYYWQAGILEDLLRFTVFNHFVGMGEYEYMAFPPLGSPFGQDPLLRTRINIMGFLPGLMFTADWATVRSHPLFTDTALYEVFVKLFIFGPPVYLAACFFRLWWTRAALRGEDTSPARVRHLHELLLAVFAAALMALVWLNKPQDYLHLAVLYWPLACLGIVQLHAFAAGRPRRLLALAAIALLPTAGVVAYSWRLVEHLRTTHTALVPGERAGIYATPTEVAMLTDVVAWVQANSEPGDRVAAIPYFPIVNFLAERDGPHRSAYIVWPFPEIPERDERIVEAMERTGTNLVIYNFTQFYSFSPVWEHAPILFEYLVRNFEIDRVFSHDAWGYKLAGLRRRDPAAQAVGRRIVPEGGEGLSLHVEGDGPPRPVPPDSRQAYLREMLWPFRPVIALRASTAGLRTVLAAPLAVPAGGGRLRSAVAVHPQWWFKLPPSWVEFTLALRDEEGRHVLYQRRLNPTVVLEDRRWFEIDVDLAAWAGREVVLELIDEAERPRGETYWMGGWEVPRLVEPASASSRAAPPAPAPPHPGAPTEDPARS